MKTSQNTSIELPVLHRSETRKLLPVEHIGVSPNEQKRENVSHATGGLATVKPNKVNSITDRLDKIVLDTESLQRAITSVDKMVNIIKSTATNGSDISLSEVELELGVTATGKIGILGTGFDIECEARMKLTFKA